jgi:abortive infection bacteriophage resistance protein
MSPDSTYAKPFLSVPEQTRRLCERGMDCGADAYASGVLERYGYYRLSGYWHLFRARPAAPEPQFDDDGREIRLDSFTDGTSLAHVVALYDFDHELRGRLSAVLSAIETSFRFFIGHRLGRIDTFAHRRPEMLAAMRASEAGDPPEPTAAYCEWLEEYERHEKRARDVFALHFRERYGPHLPIWVATEAMSFGVLSNLYTFMPQVDQEILAARLQISTADGRGDRGALANWLNSLRNLRNICAHNGRLWNRTFDVLIDVPGQTRKAASDHLFHLSKDGGNNKLYDVLLIMRHLLLSIAPDRTNVVDLADFIECQSQDVGFRMSQLGFPDGWRSEPVWDRSFSLDPLPMLSARLLDRAECLTAVDTRAALVGAKVAVAVEPRNAEQEARAKKAAQRKLLRAYLHYRVVIQVELGGAKYYPAFQFRDGKIIDALAEVNKALAGRCSGDVHPARVALAQLDWWQTPNPDLSKGMDGSSRSPVDLLTATPEADFLQIITEADATNSFAVPTA